MPTLLQNAPTTFAELSDLIINTTEPTLLFVAPSDLAARQWARQLVSQLLPLERRATLVLLLLPSPGDELHSLVAADVPLLLFIHRRQLVGRQLGWRRNDHFWTTYEATVQVSRAA